MTIRLNKRRCRLILILSLYQSRLRPSLLTVILKGGVAAITDPLGPAWASRAGPFTEEEVARETKSSTFWPDSFPRAGMRSACKIR